MVASSNLSVNTNVSALIAQTNLGRSSASLNLSLERLSTGFRINRSSDDPSGLVISEFQRAQISGLSTAIRNIDRAISLSQTAEGGLSEISGLLTELRGLTIDSANNGALDNNSLDANQANVSNIVGTITRIATSTKFGTFDLLNGRAGITAFSTNTSAVKVLTSTEDAVGAVGAQEVLATANSGTKAFVEGTATVATLAQDETLVINGVSVELQTGLTAELQVSRINEFTGQTNVVAFNNAGNKIELQSTTFGSQGSVEVVSNVASATAGSTGFKITVENDSGSDVAGKIGGIDAIGSGNVLIGTPGTAIEGLSVEIQPIGNSATARTTQTLAANQAFLVVVDNSRSFQIGAFQGDRASLTLNKVDAEALGVGLNGNRFTNLSQIDVRSVDGANDAITVIDAAIGEIARLRGEVGAFQTNTLEATQSNVQVQLTNLESAESSLRDTNFATEISNFTSSQVRQQAATTVLGLANQNSLAILNLLQGNN